MRLLRWRQQAGFQQLELAFFVPQQLLHCFVAPVGQPVVASSVAIVFKRCSERFATERIVELVTAKEQQFAILVIELVTALEGSAATSIAKGLVVIAWSTAAVITIQKVAELATTRLATAAVAVATSYYLIVVVAATATA